MTRTAIRRLEQDPTLESVLASIGSNSAGRNEDIIAFVQLLSSIEGPYTILLDSPWGDGKTFFIKSVEIVLKALNPELGLGKDVDVGTLTPVASAFKDEDVLFLPYYFNAWENDFADDPTSAILASMASEFNRNDATKDKRIGETLLKALDAAMAVFGVSANFSGVLESIRGEDLIDTYTKRATIRASINELASKANLEIANKLVIFIDELDRCRPDFAVRLLEQVKSLFQSDNIIVVISTDSVQLANAVSGLYGTEYDSGLFLERFFDLRVGLTPADPFRVVTGEPFRETTHRFDNMEGELLKSRQLTPRDVTRLLPKLSEARAYVSSQNRRSQSERMAWMVAECAFLPLLVFMEREDQELFRSVKNGTDFDALYESGKPYKAFNDALDEAIGSKRSVSDAGPVTEDDRKRYSHDLCMAIYSPNQDSETVFQARQRLGLDIRRFPAEVFKELRFPSATS